MALLVAAADVLIQMSNIYQKIKKGLSSHRLRKRENKEMKKDKTQAIETKSLSSISTEEAQKLKKHSLLIVALKYH